MSLFNLILQLSFFATGTGYDGGRGGGSGYEGGRGGGGYEGGRGGGGYEGGRGGGGYEGGRGGGGGYEGGRGGGYEGGRGGGYERGRGGRGYGRGLPHVCWSSGGGEVEVEYLVVAVGIEVDGSRLVIV